MRPGLSVFEQVTFGLKRKFARFTGIRPFICVSTNVFLEYTGLGADHIAVRTDIPPVGVRMRLGGRGHHAAHAVLESVSDILTGVYGCPGGTFLGHFNTG